MPRDLPGSFHTSFAETRDMLRIGAELGNGDEHDRNERPVTF